MTRMSLNVLYFIHNTDTVVKTKNTRNCKKLQDNKFFVSVMYIKPRKYEAAFSNRELIVHCYILNNFKLRIMLYINT